MTLVVNAATNRQLSAIRANLPGALLLYGSAGVGLATIATELCRDMTALWVRPIDIDGNTDYSAGRIRIKQIRELYERTRAKQTGKLAVIIDDADRMQRPAQTALLKLLEEPPQHVHFVLLAHNADALQPTIRSRLQAVHVGLIDDEQSQGLLSVLGVIDATRQRQLLFIAGGLPAELTRLVRDETYFADEVTLTTDARDLLTGTTYDKLVLIKRYQADRPRALRLCTRMLALGRRTLSSKPQPTLVHRLELLLEIRDNIAANHNIRLQLARFAL